MIGGLLRALDERLPGFAPRVRTALRYVFPEHWTFLFGEIALYAFVILVATGVYLTFFFDASLTPVTYHGSYAPLQGAEMSSAYRSTLDLSLETKAGLLVRQTHHWAALVFLFAIVVHLLRIFFTGSFRKPRDLNYYIGLTMLTLALLEGFAGYSLPDDLLSGMGLAIAYSVVLSIPVVGANLGLLLWDGQFPGSGAFENRLYIVHILALPALLAALIGLHLLLITLVHHTQFAGPRRTERNVVGHALWPTYALRSLGLFFATAAVLFLLGGLVQINAIWQWGPYEPWLGVNGAQPDWNLGWLIGALRLMPSFDVHLLGYTLVPNPFFGGVLFPTVVFGLLFAWPTLERLVTRDRGPHHIAQRPRDAPTRTAFGAALFSWVAMIFLAGAADRFFVSFGIPYQGQVWFFRIGAVLVPIVAFVLTRRIARELRDSGRHPLRGWTGTVVRRSPAGGYLPTDAHDRSAPGGDRGGDGDRPATPAPGVGAEAGRPGARE